LTTKKQARGKHGAKPKYEYEAKTDNQRKYLEAIDNHKVVFGVGAAGTGKSFLAIAKALDGVYTKNHHGGFKQIILTRPAVEAGEHLGSLPGDMHEKIHPYVYPLYDNITHFIPKPTLDEMIAKDIIKILPLAYMRGVTFRNAFVILDEAQNTKPSQMLCLLTRMDPKSKIVITGDRKQSDIRGVNGLEDALMRLFGITDVTTVHFRVEDIQRDKLIRDIIVAYDKDIQIEKK
jgi:phosphate starvation-inducible PhoH-like protein